MIRTTVAGVALTCVAVAATSTLSKPLTPERVAELTAPVDAPSAKSYKVSITGLKLPQTKWWPATLGNGRFAADGSIGITLPADKAQGVMEVIREFRFPVAFEPPEAKDGGAHGLTAPITPAGFETVNTGWTIRLSAKPQGKLVGLYGIADYVEPDIVNGGYGALAGPIHSQDGKLVSPNVLEQPKFQTTTTRFHVFAVPGESYEVELYRGAKSEKHRVLVTAE